jgi:hypothetical protein
VSHWTHMSSSDHESARPNNIGIKYQICVRLRHDLCETHSTHASIRQEDLAGYMKNLARVPLVQHDLLAVCLCNLAISPRITKLAGIVFATNAGEHACLMAHIWPATDVVVKKLENGNCLRGRTLTPFNPRAQPYEFTFITNLPC